MKLINQLLEKSRLLLVLYENLPKDIIGSELYSEVAEYLDDYAEFNGIDDDWAIDTYLKYIVAYNKHCKEFVLTNKYPLELGNTNFSLTREEYDVVLLLSVLFTPHRFRIMQLVKNHAGKGKSLFIGLGPGLELKLTREKFNEVSAYDLSANNYLFTAFKDVDIKMELYTGQVNNHFDCVYLIEILEHIEDPFSLLLICRDSLKKGGKIYLTTATDIPQFDHVFNFLEDHTDFESKLNEIGLAVLLKEKITHNYLTMTTQPINHFYIVEKL